MDSSKWITSDHLLLDLEKGVATDDCVVDISGPAEYMGTMGIYFHLLLADALTLPYS